MSLFAQLEILRREQEAKENGGWSNSEDNLFSADHRAKMIASGNGTMAEVYTIEDLLEEYNSRTGVKVAFNKLAWAGMGEKDKEYWLKQYDRENYV